MTTTARVLRRAIRCGELLRQIAPKHTGRPKMGEAPPLNTRAQAAKEAGLSADQRLPWLDVPLRALTAEELRADPRQARVVRRRWLERRPQGEDHDGETG